MVRACALGALSAVAPASIAATPLPVDDRTAWTSLAYRKITPNEVTVADGALHIAVDRSASPLVHALALPTTVSTIRVRGRWQGQLELPEGIVQGARGADDFVLKVGLVESGDQTLNWFRRKVAASWIVQLYELAPEGSGIEQIRFVSTTQQPELVGTTRTHPLSDLLHETRVRHLAGPGEFDMSYTFESPVETLAIWLSSDGDDTASRFDVFIDSIELEGP